MLDNRRSGRERCYLGGRISYNNGHWGEDCVIRNVSRAGAKLCVTDPRTLPDHFKLTISQRDKTFSARVRWRENDQIGVVFENDTSAEVIDFSAALARRSSILKKPHG